MLTDDLDELMYDAVTSAEIDMEWNEELEVDDEMMDFYEDDNGDEEMYDAVNDWAEMGGGAGPVYEIVQQRERMIRRFNIIGRDIHIRVPPFDRDLSYEQLLQEVHRVFDVLLEDLLENVAPQDKVRLTLYNNSMRFEIWLPFMEPHELTAEKVLQEIEKMLQSNQEFLLHEDIFIHLIHAPVIVGGAYGAKMGCLEKELKQRQCFIQIRAKNYCLPRSIVVAMARVENHPSYETLRKIESTQKTAALNLQREAGLPDTQTQYTFEDFEKFQKILSPDYQLVIVSRTHYDSVIYKGPASAKQLFVYYAENHFSVITKMTAFLRRSYFCVGCMKGFKNKFDHMNCATSCNHCHTSPVCVLEANQKCSDCRRNFVSVECYQKHKDSGLCKNLYICKNCGELVKMTSKGYKHRCGFKKCTICQKEVEIKNHLCYMSPVPPPPSKDGKSKSPQLYICYDFESLLSCNSEHQPNLCVAQITCEYCISDSMDKICPKCNRKTLVFKGKQTVDDFCSEIFSSKYDKAVCLAHNSKAYDLHFILQYVHKQGLKPQLIQNGLKLITMKVCGITFLDSLNFIPMALEKIPAVFELKEMCKGFFPHLFSIPEHQEYEGCIPDMKYYDPEGMSESKRIKFEKWYHENKHKPFNYQDELEKYCRSDVDILRQAVGAFRTMFLKVSNVDPFKESVTIASACNKVFRRNFLKENHIAIIPPQGYGAGDRSSALALAWLLSMEKERGCKIRSVVNGGEITIAGYKVDGILDPAPQPPHVRPCSLTVFEFQGCLFHGCPKCYDPDLKNPISQITMRELYNRTQKKVQKLESLGFIVIQEWECIFRKKMDKELQQAYQEYKHWEPLDPRESFYGGRTNAIVLHKTVEPTEKIEYLDYTSLYPWVSKYGEFPLGHPIVSNKGDPDMPQNLENIKGLAKCTILPPSNLYHPVLPYRHNKKLLFPLCRTCTEMSHQDVCPHENPKDRTLTGTWVVLEIQKALEKGYKLIEIHSIWHFEESTRYNPETRTGGLFTEYVDTFLKLKQESSDFPEKCTTEEEKIKYIADYYENEGIQLEMDNITKNEGLRNISKLCLNSLWGKFGQRTLMDKITFTDDIEEYLEMMSDESKTVKDITYANEECVGVKWRTKEEFSEGSNNTNVVIAAYTTAQARLHLYQELEKLDKRVLYMDTDSIIFTTKPGDYNPPISSYLGGFKSELDANEYIQTFVSGGPKNYAYSTSLDKTVCKIRGFSLNSRNSSILNYDVMKHIITTAPTTIVPINEPYKIIREKGKIYTKQRKKDYRIVYNKRIIGQNYITYPYGWKNELINK